MMQRITLLVALLGLACLFTLPAFAQQPPPYVNVVDYGATPDSNGDDDAPQIEAAIAAACSGNGPRAVFFPKGEYAIQTTIDITSSHDSVKLFGTGMRRTGAANNKWSQITWNANTAGGSMIKSQANLGLRVEDLCLMGDMGRDGTNRAGKGFEIRWSNGYGSGQCSFQRVSVEYCDTGFDCANENCNADMTFIEFVTYNCTTGFKTNGSQNVNYVFIRPEITWTNTGFSFDQGGSVVIEGFSCGRITTGIKIGAGGSSCGNFTVNGYKPEMYIYGGTRTCVLDAAGTNVVKISSLCANAQDVENDKTTPLFKLAGNSHVLVESSQLQGYKLADITGQSWLQLNNCIHYYHDPRVEGAVTHASECGFEVLNGMLNCSFFSTRHDHAIYTTPMQPSNFTGTPASSTQINLSWTDNSNNEDGFRIYYKVGAGGTWTYCKTSGADTTSTSVTGLTAGTTYYFYTFSFKGTYAKSNYVYSAAITTP